jgi:phage baseplate assembly protein W
MDFTRNPVTGELARVTNAEAVRQSIVNLVMTDPKERPYQPYLGSRVQESLFDLVDDPMTIENIRDSIRDVIEKNEPRASIIKIDIGTVDNSIRVDIHYGLINIQQVFTATVFLDRIR